MWRSVDIAEFLEAEQPCIVDVRSPAEFAHAHIPGALNLPLFDNAERAQVGTLYKQEGHDTAVLKGLEIAGPKAANLAKEGVRLSAGRPMWMHCWRGGMRSQAMAQLMSLNGIKGQVLTGGYKSYRAAVHNTFLKKYNIIILGGRTGSGKTLILKSLAEKGEQVIDLEGMAGHKGSAFGNLEQTPQPSTEFFENILFESLRKMNQNKRVWVEDESHLVGHVFIPEAFWEQMRQAPIFFIDIPEAERVRFLVQDYMQEDGKEQQVEEALSRIRKKLGGQHFQAALEAFQSGDYVVATQKVLAYYDKSYAYGMAKRVNPDVRQFSFEQIEPEKIANKLINIL